MKLFSLPHALRFPLIVIATLFCQVNPALSQASNIVPDNTLGESSSQVTENVDGQPNELITGGAQREQNLFHSFQEFNVGEGRGAFFANPEAVSNIFSRVTGSNPSNILGTLGVNGAANLYLINPNGIIFGENSSLDVQGSFTATTGNGIRFGEQGEFKTINPQTPQSLTINPSAYLFNQIADGDISSIESQGDFLVPEGENIVLLGGDLNLKGGLVVAPGGTVELGSVNDTGEIAIGEDSNLIFSQELARGDISLSNGLFIIVPTVPIAGEGSINVYSQNFNLTERSRMFAGIFQDLGDSDTVGGDVVIDVLGTVSLDDSSISNAIAENAEGTTGKIEVEAESVVLQNGGYISTDTLGRGDGGDINIDATESVIVDGENSDGRASRISSNVRERAEGNAGKIEIDTVSLDVTSGGLISSDIRGRGDGGDIKINTNSLRLTNDADISSNIIGIGDGGNITIDATESVIVGERSNSDFSGISSSVFLEGQGNAGDIEITTNSLKLTNSAFISSSITGTGDGGDINITATESVVVDGEKNNRPVSQISSDIGFKGAKGNAGDIEITTGSLRLTNGGRITSETFGGGSGGDITIDATESVVIDGENRNSVASRISSDSNGAANFGELEINTDSLRLTNGGRITANNSGLANEGSISINATESVIIDGETSNGGSSRISSNVERGRKAGEIIINTSLLQLINSGFITTDTSELANGEAGEILIEADFVLLGEDSAITTESNSEENAGNITLNAFNTLVLENGSITSRSVKSAGGEIKIVAGDIRLRGDSDIVTNVIQGVEGGGDITITADSVIAFDDSDIFAFAQDGTGGNITLNTPAFFGENFTSNSLTDNPDLLDDNSRVDLNATGAVSGDISIPNVSFIQNSLSELPDNSLNTDELLANSCVVPIGNREQGQFIITGGESLPVRPGDSLPSRYSTREVRNLPDNNNWQSGDRIVEPQGAYRLANGKLVLSRECQ